MKKYNAFAKVWYQAIINGSRSYDECPDTVLNKYPVKSQVKELLELYGYEELITED